MQKIRLKELIQSPQRKQEEKERKRKGRGLHFQANAAHPGGDGIGAGLHTELGGKGRVL